MDWEGVAGGFNERFEGRVVDWGSMDWEGVARGFNERFEGRGWIRVGEAEEDEGGVEEC